MDPTRLPQAPYGPRFGDGVRQEPSMERRTFRALVSGGLLAVPLTAPQRPNRQGRSTRSGFSVRDLLKGTRTYSRACARGCVNSVTSKDDCF